MEKLRPIKGTQSLFGPEAEAFNHVTQVFDRVRRLYGFSRVEVPMFEATGVFARTMGETSDVVSKEMWTFDSRSEGSVTLRPEFTAGIARAFLSEGWQQHAPMKVATHGAAFRYERPQKGRYRQFHQLDAEIIGSADPLADVELLCMGAQLLKELGIGGVTLKLNTLGDAESRDNWRAALVEHFAAHRAELSEDSQERLEKNPLRILDSKDPRDRPFADSAPAMTLSSEASDYFEAVKRGLDAAGVAYDLDPHRVRGLDYYRHTAFEFVTDRLGAQGTVLAGGRYDGLIEQLGGSHTPAVGWAAGIERLAMLVREAPASPIDAAVIPMGEAATGVAVAIAGALRRTGLATELFASGKMKKRMARADEQGALAAIVIGDDEIEAGEMQVKVMATGEQRALPPAAAVDMIADLAVERQMQAVLGRSDEEE